MDLSNKTFVVTRLSVNNIERKSVIQATVSQNITDTIKSQVGVFDFTLDKTFTGIDDPQLNLAVAEVLEGIPE